MNKFLTGIIITTLAIVAGGFFLFNKIGKNTPTTSGPKIDSAILIRADSQKISTSSAKVTLVEFGDYQCPACASYEPLIKQLFIDFKGQINFVFRDFPLDGIHQNARIGAYAAEAAGKQSKFWEMHDKLYTDQKNWSESSDARNIIFGYAKDMGLNLDQFKKDLDSDTIKVKVDRDVADGTTAGVDATPTFFLDGQKLQLVSSYQEFKDLVTAAISKTTISQTPSDEYHIHFDLKVYMNGVPVDLSLAKYQSTEQKELDANIHLHDGNGKIVHVHKKGVTLSELFKSINISFGSDILKVFVNGQPTNKLLDYVPQDLDKILVTSGDISEAHIQTELDSVTNDACIYSLKCPERGKPPTENCVGGLGTGCSD